MVERLTLVDKQKLTYEGIFVMRELYEVMDKWMEAKGYHKRELKSSEIVKPKGRNIDTVFEPWKQLSDYAKSVFKVKLSAEKVRDIVIEKEGIKHSMNQGIITFTFDAYLETDFEHRWENKPGFFFVRVLFDKYIFKPFTTNYQNHVMGDFKQFIDEIRGSLNLHRY